MTEENLLKFHYSKDLPRATELKEKYLKEQVKTLKKIFQPEQKSKEWYEMRNNMLTASDWGTVLGENHYSNSNEVLKKKCGDDTFFTNAAMQWGNKYESVAVLIYEHRNDVKVLEFGCLQHPFIPFLGASPDGITEDGVMLEIKCPTSRKITGIPPRYYWCQVQGQLEVCELDRCDFLECSIKEYADEEEYLNDNYNGDYLRNKFGNEKGIVVEVFKKNDKSFFFDYSPVCFINKELELWKDVINYKYNKDNFIVSSYSYWYLEEVSCVPIYRNQEWFNQAKVELEIFWNKVLKYRKLGFQQLLSDLQKEKDEKKIAKEEKKNAKEEKKIAKPKKISSSTSSKNQKNMRDFIVLDDIKEVIDKQTSSDSSDLDVFDDDDDNFASNTQSSKSLFS